MRRFRGQKLSKDKDFFVHDSNFDYISNASQGFTITLGDIPKDELLATAASIQDDTFVKLGLRNHTVKRPTGTRAVSCTANAAPRNAFSPAPLSTFTKASKNVESKLQVSESPRSVSMFVTPTVEKQQPETERSPTEEYHFKSLAPQRVSTHKNKLSIDHDFAIGVSPKAHRSTGSLIAEIIETYTELYGPDESAQWSQNSLPELVKCMSFSSSSMDTASQFSFEISQEERLDTSHTLSPNKPHKKNISISSKPLPPIPVRKLSQSDYRDYDLKPEKAISMDTGILVKALDDSTQTGTLIPNNDYILSRTGGDNFDTHVRSEKVNQDETDVEMFTRKCSSSSSKYSFNSSSDEQATAPTTPKSGSFKDTRTPDMITSPCTPELMVYKRNPYSPKQYRRNLTPINEKNGYQSNRTRLCVINN